MSGSSVLLGQVPSAWLAEHLRFVAQFGCRLNVRAQGVAYVQNSDHVQKKSAVVDVFNFFGSEIAALIC